VPTILSKKEELMSVKRATQLGMLVLVTIIAALIIGVHVKGQGDEIPFDDARIIIEVNATDGDAGIQIFLDGEDWAEIEIFGPDGETIFEVEGQGSLGEHGATELFIESAEPSFEDLPLEEFLLRFPAGEYRFSGVTVEGDHLVGTATLTHAIPDGPVLVSPEEDSVQDPNNTVVRWEPVPDPPGSEIVEYEVIVEREDPLRVFSVRVPATVTSVTVPPEFLEPGTEYKFEVLAIEAGGNQTISERSFETAG
jgi:hypothetical protein